MKEVDVEHTFNLIKSEEMAKFIGIFAHLAYWLVFGHVNPIELDNVSKKQMFVQLYEILMEFNTRTKVILFLYFKNEKQKTKKVTKSMGLFNYANDFINPKNGN